MGQREEGSYELNMEFVFLYRVYATSVHDIMTVIDNKR